MKTNTGVALSYDLSSVARLQSRISRLAALDRRALLDDVGAEVENQTVWRIEEEKSSPDGTPWVAWSPAYAETREGQHSYLVGDSEGGGLVGTIVHRLKDDDSVEIGSNLIYSGVHQFGSAEDSGQNIPARPYLGLSVENEGAVEAIVDNFIDRLLGL